MTRHDTITMCDLFRASFGPGILNAPSGPGRKFQKHQSIQENSNETILVAKKRVRDAIEDRHQGEPSIKRRKPNDCMISAEGMLTMNKSPDTWKCEVCLASCNSVNSDKCEACTEPRPTKDEHKKPTCSSRDPVLFAGSEGFATGRITPQGFVFLGPGGAESKEAGIAEIVVLNEAPLKTSPVIRRRVRAKRPSIRPHRSPQDLQRLQPVLKLCSNALVVHANEN